MKETMGKSLRDCMKQQTDFMAIACAVVYRAVTRDNSKAVASTVYDLMEYGFFLGWNAAIDYCMQPAENEVPAEAATSDEHTNNIIKPIISAEEGKVNE